MNNISIIEIYQFLRQYMINTKNDCPSRMISNVIFANGVQSRLWPD